MINTNIKLKLSTGLGGKMRDNNKVIYSKECINKINLVLDNLIVNPYIGCNYKFNNEIDNEVIVLDTGATEILKAYYKSKLRMIDNG